MHISHEELQEAANIALDNPRVMKLMRQWNEATEWGVKDQILCQVMSTIKELKEEGFVLDIINEEEVNDLGVPCLCGPDEYLGCVRGNCYVEVEEGQ